MIQAVLRTYSTRRQHQINFFEATVIWLPCFDLGQVGRKEMGGAVSGENCLSRAGHSSKRPSMTKPARRRETKASPSAPDRHKDEKIQAF